MNYPNLNREPVLSLYRLLVSSGGSERTVASRIPKAAPDPAPLGFRLEGLGFRVSEVPAVGVQRRSLQIYFTQGGDLDSGFSGVRGSPSFYGRNDPVQMPYESWRLQRPCKITFW